MSTDLGDFLKTKREAMVHYADLLLAQRLGAERAPDLAEDVVQQAALKYLERVAAGREPVWKESRFVGLVRYAAMRAAVVARDVVELRNTAAEGTRGRGRRSPGSPQRGRVTNLFPNQVFGRGLAEPNARKAA